MKPECSVFVIIPKKPFYDWANYIMPDFPTKEFNDFDGFMAPYDMGFEDAEKWIEKNFDKIFKYELVMMWDDPDDWPKNRSFKIFEEWFDWKYVPGLTDLDEIEFEI